MELTLSKSPLSDRYLDKKHLATHKGKYFLAWHTRDCQTKLNNKDTGDENVENCPFVEFHSSARNESGEDRSDKMSVAA